jgi:hypothetical protein
MAPKIKVDSGIVSMEQLYGLSLLKRWTKKGTENIRFWSNNIPNPSLASMGWVLRFN